MESNKLKIRQQALQLIDRIDHTNLKICATEKDIINLCNEAKVPNSKRLHCTGLC